jgi:hypothetical protein
VQARGESFYPVSGDKADTNSATSPTSLVRAHVLTAKEVEAAKRDFAKMVNTLSSTNKDGQAEESGRQDGEALANVAKQYEYLHSTDWWSFWFIKTYGDEEDLAKKIALRRYGNDEVKVDPYVDSFVERYKTIIDEGRFQFAQQEFDKLKFFINQPLNVWNEYYGPSVDEGHWHQWKTDRFDLMARTYAGKVEYVSVTPVSGLAYLSRDNVKALGESLGLKMTEDYKGNFNGQNDQLFVEGGMSGVSLGIPQNRERNLMDWDMDTGKLK